MGNCLKKQPSAGRDHNAGATSSSQEPTTSLGRVVTPNLKRFTIAELNQATRNFHHHNFLGEGGFGTVYKGWLNPSTYVPSNERYGVPVAVKKLNPGSRQGHAEWQAEVNFLGRLSHPNIVQLVGYLDYQIEHMLVYEYMPKGSLFTHLFESSQPLSWSVRIKIAIGAAQGVAFLHTTAEALIYRDIKSANILLDEEFNAKLSDFGLARLGPPVGHSHISTENVIGTMGYAAPEYISSGHIYLSSDVYGFGAVLLELVTGLRVFDASRPVKERNLVEWLKPNLKDKKKIRNMIDGRLADNYPFNGAKKLVKLISRCVEDDPHRRPSMGEVVFELQDINSSDF